MESGNRLRERAAALPVLGFLLFTPPVLAIFGRAASVAGIPLSYAYIFGAWLALIGLGITLARRLPDSEARADGRAGDTVPVRAASDAPGEG